MMVILLHVPTLRHEDLKNMLDSSKDSQKLDAMKMIVGVRVTWIFTDACNRMHWWSVLCTLYIVHTCIVSMCVCICVCMICVHSVQMVAKGKDCSDLFPAVVKNVVSKNSEVCMYNLVFEFPLPMPLSLCPSLPPSLPSPFSSCFHFTFPLS